MRQDEIMAIEGNGQKLLMTGNEAVARGAIEAGVSMATGYPGTPSSEILENLSLVAKDKNMYLEWSTNEKVAFETAYGGAMTGLRTLVTMKHEGGNVILDSLSKMIYTGTKGGFLIITCDDPGALSSSNEQDNRFFGQFVEIPVFEPSTPQEAKDMIIKGFEISEKYSLPIIIRLVTRISHGKSRVVLEKIMTMERIPYFDRNDEIKDRWFCCAFNHLEKHRLHHKSIAGFKEKFIIDTCLNQVEGDDGCKWGIITSGIAYGFIREGLRTLGIEKDISILKLGVVYPLCADTIKDFIKSKEKILVFEESDPFVENQVRILAQMNNIHTPIHGQLTGDLERPGEMTIERTFACLEKVFDINIPTKQSEDFREKSLEYVINRPLTMCSGCPHRATHMALAKALKKLKIQKPIIFGDIGCYELGHEPPFDDMDSIYNMGAGVGLANGIVQSGVKEPVLALIGDSTLLHSGISGFTNAVHGKANITMIVFDNSTIAMTGHQAPINSSRTLMGDESQGIDIGATLRAANAAYVEETDAFDIEETQKAIEKAIQTMGPSAVVVKGPCALEYDRIKRKEGIVSEAYRVDHDECIGCKICTEHFGCPALMWDEKAEKVTVDSFVCNGCGVCVQVCSTDAFIK